MARGYGRSAKAGTGQTLGQAYDFGPQAAQAYLSGDLAREYQAQSSVISKDLPTEVGGGKRSRQVEAQIAGKSAAKKSLGKLREIASANAVGSFLKFAHSKGRGSMATASQGFLTVDPISGYGEGAQAQTEGRLGGWGKHQKRIRRQLGVSRGAPLADAAAALKERTTASFTPGAAMTYRGATGGGDSRAALHQSFQRLKAGASTTAEEGINALSPTFASWRYKQQRSFGNRGQFDYASYRQSASQRKPIDNPQALYYQHG